MTKKLLFCFVFLITVFLGSARMSDRNKMILDIGIVPPTYWYIDKDGDGFGASIIEDEPIISSTQPPGYVSNHNDYDDTDPNITNVMAYRYYRDFDLDTYGNPNESGYYSVKPAGYVSNSSDCNDNDSSLNPSTVWYRDADGDGYGTSSQTVAQCAQPAGYIRNAGDYDDYTANITNIPPQIYYQDADGDTFGNPNVAVYYSIKPGGYVNNSGDCNDADITLNPNTPWFRDSDGDSYGDYSIRIVGCSQPGGYVRNGEDYNDATPYITDIPPQTFYRDADGDSYGNPGDTIYYSVIPGGYVTNNWDCYDGDPSLNPYTVWYRDADGDGYGTAGQTLTQCAQPGGYVRNASDYNDSTANITNIAPQTFYRDADGDGYGNPGDTIYYSVLPGGYVTNNWDCHDGDSSLNPNTVWYRDADGDGYGNAGQTLTQCGQPGGYVRNASDYNDSTVNITSIAPQTFYKDADGDGYGNPGDTIYYSVLPGGYVTNNWDCHDGDSSLNPNTVWYRDADGDGYGNAGQTLTQCAQPGGYVRNASDYNDSTVNITNIAPQTFYRDADGDTFGSSGTTVYYSVMPGGYVTNSSDCNDGDSSLNPNTVWYRDADGDSYGISTTTLAQCTQPAGYVRNSSDYNDTTVNITNIAPQTFYRDADGDTFGSSSVTVYYSVKPAGYVTNSTDCNDGDSSLNPNTVWYRDADGDGYGVSSPTLVQCAQPAGYVRNSSDYNDTTVNINNIAPQTFYRDADGDTFGSSSVTVYYSVKPAGYVTNSTDCNDGDSSLNPNTVWYRDADGDSYGISTTTLVQCAQPVGYVRNSSDYNDTTVNITNIAPQTFYRDADGDTFGSSSVTVYYSVKPAGYVTNSSDCNDADVTLNPNTIWYRDADGDGYGVTSPTLTQCNQPAGYVRNTSDYNDTTINITNIAPQYFYQDSDNDTFGNSSVSLYYSVKPTGYVSNATDCNDAATNINPNTKWYADNEGDGLGDPSSFLQQCVKPAGDYVLDNTDNCPLIRGTGTDCSNVKAPSLDQNYIITTTYKKATTTAFVNPDPSKAQVNITYFDGLGRPMQQIGNQQSASGKDIITHIEYDAFGRQIKDYLPFVSTGSNMEYDQNALTNTISYFNKTIYDNTSNPFSEKKLESSPLNRVLKQAAPGTDWAMNAGHEIKLDYQTNTDTEVKLYKATTTWNAGSGLYDIAFSDDGNYGVNQLYKTITYDENTSSSPSEGGGSTVEFKNKEGQVVLKRTYESGTKHDTYYVYDSYGNLTYVLPPMFTNGAGQLDGLCYQYKYDNRNRLAEKKLPGKQWEFIVYDKLDRPVATGPATSPFKDDTAVGWLITKYDAFGRPVYTGWYNSVASSSTRKSLQDAQNTATVLFETKQTSGAIDGIPVYYTNAVAPTNIKLFTVNYYDNYVFPNVPTVPTTVEGQNVLTNTKTLATGSWTRTVTTASAILGETAAVFYDAKARPIRNAVTNYLGGYTITDSKLDSFSRQLQYTINKHKRTTADTELTVKDIFTYSLQDRLLTHTHQINGGAAQLLADNAYDELGQLTSKKVGNSSGAPLQKIDYTYNIRGWMTAINNDPTNNLVLNTTEKDLFGFKINYNTIAGTVPNVKALYNGNIAETYWRTDTPLRKYGYVYDNLNRLKSAVYQKPNDAIPVSGAYNESLSYDKNGNIVSLQRFGTSDAPSIVFQIDDLAYEYSTTNGNLLTKVTDSPSGNNGKGFIDGNKTGDDYNYDTNGNLISDKNKSITAITYNQLNLPKKITFATTGSIEYIYNATGQKLEKIVTAGTVVTSTNYLGGYQYLKPHLGSWALQFFPTAEGYFNQKQGTAIGVGDYVFQYKDHLGNVRLSYSDADKNGSIATTEIVEESNYYPFGLKHEGYNPPNGGGNSEAQKYKYNGKELQDELGLNMYDYGARNYDPALGRWMNIDPLAEVTRRFSPYNYALNNPVFFVDPDGMTAEAGQSGNYYDWDEKQYKNKDTGKTVTAEEAIASHTGESNGDGDPPKKQKPGLFKQFLLAVPVLGATIQSSDKMGEGDYFGAALDFGVGVLDAFTLGAANKYRTGTAGVLASVEVVTAEQASKFGGLSIAENYGVKSYSSLKALLKGKGLQAHHLLEQRFASTLGVTPGSMSSIALTVEEHQVFTNAWRAKIGYDGSKAAVTTSTATKAQIHQAAKEIYKNYPAIIKALGL